VKTVSAGLRRSFTGKKALAPRSETSAYSGWSSIGRLLRQKETPMPNVHELIRDHVTLSIRCLDRLYLHAYMPKLQTSGGLCYFLRDHLGHPIPSPALFAPMLDRFVGAITTYATTRDVPLITFERGQRKDDVVTEHRARRPLADGVVVIGVAQEKMRALQGAEAIGPPGRRHVRFLATIGRRQSLLLLRAGS
jgi:hypothetical protein